MQTIYFYQDKAKIESFDRESWLIGDEFYAINLVGDTEYLVQFPSEESEMTVEDMMGAYRTSKSVEGIDCELDAASEAIVTLPDLEIITNEELGEMMLDQMMAGYN